MSCSLSSKRSDYAELPHGRQQTQQPPNSAMRHNPSYGIMTQLVQRSAVPVDRLEIGLGRRDLHIVERRDVKGAIAADAEVDARGTDQRLDLGLDQARRRRWRDDGDVFRQAFALRGVEHREALEERNRLGLVSALAGAPLLVVGHEAVGIDHGRAALVFADIAAERQRLAEGEPALAGKAVFDDGAPEDQDVDPRIVPAGGGVSRHGEWRFRRRRPPGLDPGYAASLQLADDLAGDFVVEARPVLAGASGCGLSGHRGSPRRAPEASLPALNPSRQSRPHSHSRGRCGVPPQKGSAETAGSDAGEGFPLLSVPAFRRSAGRRAGVIGAQYA